MPNSIVQYEPGAAAFAARLFGFSPAEEDLARLAGALDGAVVNVSVRAQKGWLYLAVSDPARFEVYETSVRRDAADKLFAYIHEVRVALGQSQQGLGLRAFIRQVAGAQAMELAYFKLWAAGNRLDTARNGYYTWARFGFDAPLSGYHRRLLTNSLRGARTVNEVIERGGSRWWWFNGDDTEMYFDLAEQSTMLRVFNAYLTEKGLTRE